LHFQDLTLHNKEQNQHVLLLNKYTHTNKHTSEKIKGNTVNIVNEQKTRTKIKSHTKQKDKMDQNPEAKKRIGN